jgi:hypothetical protein
MFDSNSNPHLPPQVEASLQFLRFARAIEQPDSFGDIPPAGRPFSRIEAEVYDSSLTILLEYFTLPLDPKVPRPTCRHEHDH